MPHFPLSVARSSILVGTRLVPRKNLRRFTYRLRLANTKTLAPKLWHSSYSLSIPHTVLGSPHSPSCWARPVLIV